MKVLILAGGAGTRLAEETRLRPKPMVEIGGRPILWHVMSIYARAGFSEFVVASGYKGEEIERWSHSLDEAWQVDVVDTGPETMTGGRILRLRPRLGQGTFLTTYGDGLADLDVRELVRFHRAHGKLATVTAVRPPSRFGALALDGERVREFSEKPQAGEGWINGGFFAFEPGVFDYLAGDETILERDPLERLAREGQLMAFRHAGFWQPMDTLREKRILEDLWSSGRAPWIASA
ncbi:MAG: glucose-1-phosphate cytidylyltransferase [Planctomycetota bacterium]